MDEKYKRLKELGVILITIDGIVVFNANEQEGGENETECTEDK